jgi:hypothetical protein
MAIQGNEKLKVQKTINDIAEGNFDERDVDSLFMGLRAHSASLVVFREIADFVAHNDLREKGLTNQSLEAFYLSFKYFSEYITPKKSLDIISPFPIYIKKLMKYQIDKCDERVLREKFNVTQERLKSRIDNLFKDNKKEKTTSLKNGKISKPNFEALQHVLGFIGSKPAYTQEQIVSELLSVIKANDLELDEEKFLQQSDKITLCILTLIHKSNYDIKGHKHGFCEISCENLSYPYNQNYVDADGNNVQIEHSHGKLQINGHVTVINRGKDLTVCYPVLQTELATEDWCDENMYSIEQIDAGNNQIMYKKVIFDSDIGINEQFRLVAINA